MRLDAESTIAGLPVRTIRDFLRRAMDRSWNSDYLAERLDLSAERADETVERLRAEGLVAPDGRTAEDACYRVTTAGRRFRNITERLVVGRGDHA